MATIKELAEQCGVSEQALRAYCRRKQTPKDSNGSYTIPKALENEILLHYMDTRAKGERKAESETKGKHESTADTAKDETIAILKQQVDFLQRELENVTALLDQQQKLMLLDRQRIAELESKAESLKADEVPNTATESPQEPQMDETTKSKQSIIDRIFKRYRA